MTSSLASRERRAAKGVESGTSELVAIRKFDVIGFARVRKASNNGMLRLENRKRATEARTQGEKEGTRGSPKGGDAILCVRREGPSS
jgi:hypothetical protein